MTYDDDDEDTIKDCQCFAPKPTYRQKSSGKDDATMDLVEKPSSNDADGHQVVSITDAVASLARFIPKPFLHGLFKKLIHRLLEEVQSENGESEKICSLLIRIPFCGRVMGLKGDELRVV
jgi:hypothetical protein